MTRPNPDLLDGEHLARLRDLAAAEIADGAAAYRRTKVFSAPALERCRDLLVDLWAAGTRHGVQFDRWRTVTNLSGAVLDVLHYPAPQDVQQGRNVVDAVLAAVLELRGEGAASRRDAFSIQLHATSESMPCTPISSYGGKAFVLQLHRDGWEMWIDRTPVAADSRPIKIESGFDAAGIRGAAQVAVEANEGGYGDSLFERR